MKTATSTASTGPTGKLARTDVDKDITRGDEKKSTLALPPNKSEEDENNLNGEIGVGSNSSRGNFVERRSSEKF